jgi:hypothetical protein
MRKALFATSLFVLLSTPAALQAQLDLGAQGSWGDEFDFAAGARVTLGIPGSLPLELHGAFDYFFPERDSLTYWELNGNITAHLPEPGGLSPYVGLGLNVANTDIKETIDGEAGPVTISRHETEFGVNFVGGLKYKTGSLAPFGEVRWEAGGSKQFVATIGLMLNIGPGLTPVTPD